jgi:hypothetical protein
MDKMKIAELSKEIFIALISKIEPMHLGEFDTLKKISNVDKANNIFNSIYDNIVKKLQG